MESGVFANVVAVCTRVVGNHWCVGIGVVVPYTVLRGKLNVLVGGEMLEGALEGGREGIASVVALLQNGNGSSSFAGGVCLVNGDPRFAWRLALAMAVRSSSAQVMCWVSSSSSASLWFRLSWRARARRPALHLKVLGIEGSLLCFVVDC